MKRNQEEKSDDMTLGSLEQRLRHLPEPGVPEALEARLLAVITSDTADVSISPRIVRYPRLWDFWATAAAAILIIALMLTANYGLFVSSRTLSMQLRDTSLLGTAWDRYPSLGDQNTLIEDTNYAACK
ncbi:MAG: hypothetical protein ACYSTF_09555 [Planctomycetota bacterium]|jgi:hypothetical protein